MGKKLTIEEMKELAEFKGRKCLSSNYNNAHTKLEWECKHGHRWMAIPQNIKKGHWCPLCYNNKRMTRHLKSTMIV